MFHRKIEETLLQNILRNAPQDKLTQESLKYLTPLFLEDRATGRDNHQYSMGVVRKLLACESSIELRKITQDALRLVHKGLFRANHRPVYVLTPNDRVNTMFASKEFVHACFLSHPRMLTAYLDLHATLTFPTASRM
jgi:hypothetical protein